MKEFNSIQNNVMIKMFSLGFKNFFNLGNYIILYIKLFSANTKRD
ncbi:Uncharacterised protein [Staphylococcus carnosus]|nr:hypothetical protein SCA05_07660 [Staphylococcus carnosus]SUL89329.1 Uncharacterised protein [Staphylococcus carnosus]SUM04969.1 Uncharacterised protein [Staphylococcus carnosus]